VRENLIGCFSCQLVADANAINYCNDVNVISDYQTDIASYFWKFFVHAEPKCEERLEAIIYTRMHQISV